MSSKGISTKGGSTVGAYEAKTKFSELLERVENGERITITRHGKIVAELIPAPKHDRTKAMAAMDRIRELRRDVDLGDMTWEDIKKLRDEGRP